MKEPIQNSGDEVAIVIYDAPLPPKYFRITKRFIRTSTIVIPILIAILILSFFLWGFGERLRKTPVPDLPNIISETDSKINALRSPK